MGETSLILLGFITEWCDLNIEFQPKKFNAWNLKQTKKKVEKVSISLKFLSRGQVQKVQKAVKPEFSSPTSHRTEYFPWKTSKAINYV